MTRIRLTNTAQAGLGGGASGASAGVRAALLRGVKSTCIALIGDSTGTDTDEWFGLLGQKIADKHPDWSLGWRTWDDSAVQDYTAPTLLQTGTAGERYVAFNSGSLRHVYSTAQTGDQEVRARVARTVWATGAGTGTQTIISRWDSTSRGWYLWLDGFAKLNWTWSVDGTTTAGTITSTTGVPFADDTPGWVRVTHDVDNGAGGHTVTFYTSPDGATWTQLGTPVVTATATSIFGTTTDIRLGAAHSTPYNFLAGRIYWAEYRPGTLGTNPISVVAPMPDDWEQMTTSSSISFGGAPVLMLLNGSISGRNVAYFDDSTRRVRLTPPHGQQLQIISTNHNEGNYSGERWLTPLSAFVTNVRNRLMSFVPIVLMTENPITREGIASPQPQRQVDIRAARGQSIMAYAQATAGVEALDVTLAYPNGVVGLVEPADGLHPTKGWSGGSGLWANYAFAELDF